MKNSLVLIADIEASREVRKEEREELQQKLKHTLDSLNKQGAGIVSPYTITLGDEFQAVFDKADGVFIQMLKILGALHPLGVRFSLAVGSIDTPLNTEQAIGMDGPAFHEAREGVELLKKSGFLFNIRIENEESLPLKIINNSLQLLSQQVRGWNKRRIIILHMLKEGYDYKAITKKLGISSAAFYKNKDAGLLDVIDDLSNNLASYLNKKMGS